MNEQQKQRIEQIALFRFGVLGDLVSLTPGDARDGRDFPSGADLVGG